jgi:Na+/proline symporter
VNPDASQQEIRLLAYASMILIGALAVLANLQPVSHLQKLVVFSTSSTASAFLVPLVMLCYWRRANAAGAIAAMLTGVITVVSLYGLGIARDGWQQLEPLRPLSFDPMMWSSVMSLIVGAIVTGLTNKPEERLAAKYFDAEDIASKPVPPI